MRTDHIRRWWAVYLVDGLWELGEWEIPPPRFSMQVRIGDRERAIRTVQVWNRGRKQTPKRSRSACEGADDRVHQPVGSGECPIIPVIGHDAGPASGGPNHARSTGGDSVLGTTSGVDRRVVSGPRGVPAGGQAMMRSEEIGKLAAALAASQGAMEKARRSGRNDHFRSRYPTLDDLLEVAKASLSQHGLAFTQCTGTEPGSGLARVTTTLLHESGEWMGSELEYPVEGNVQQLGGVFTYLKRQALSSMLGISCDPDDDGEGDRITHGARKRAADAPTPPARAERTSSGSSGRGSASPASGKPVTITATIANVAARPIENGGTKYAIEFDGWSERWASTFDEARGKFALDNKGAMVEARVVKRGKWWNVDELKVVTPAGGEVSEPEIPF